jgi:hypothetical protein
MCDCVPLTRPTDRAAAGATKQRGTSFAVVDTTHNLGAAAAGPTTTRYYLSLDTAKSPSDTLLTGGRAVPGLAAGASHSGTVTVTIPAATPPNTYFVLACADAPSMLAETDENNNCKAFGTTVTVTP